MKKINKLEQLLKEADVKQEFNIVEDLKNLQLSYGILKSRDFRKKLGAVVEKYENSELTEIREALVNKCRSGDTQAIRLYAEYFKPAAADNTDDGLMEALSAAGKGAFDDEV